MVQSPVASSTKSTLSDCPEGVAVGSLCLTGRDSFGAYYWLAVPHNWKGTFVVHSHGGPELGEPKVDLTFVELESSFKSTLAAGGSSDRLVQTFTQDQDHSYTSDAQYASTMRALIVWVQQGKKPTPASIAASCKDVAADFDPAKGCRSNLISLHKLWLYAF